MVCLSEPNNSLTCTMLSHSAHRSVGLKVPRRSRHELRDMRVDFLAILVDGSGCETSLPWWKSEVSRQRTHHDIEQGLKERGCALLKVLVPLFPTA